MAIEEEKIKIYNETETTLEVGIHYLEGEVDVVFPKYLDALDIKRSTLLLLRALEKYRNKRNRKTDFDTTRGGESVFYSYIYLIRHYFESGLYEEQTRISKLNEKGRINFNKTIQRVTPIVYNDSITYPELYAYKTITNNQNEIVKIMKYALKLSFERAGFILGFNFNPFKEEHKIASKNAICILKNRINSTNNDKEINLLKKLLAVYTKEEINDLKEVTNTTIKLNDINNLFNDFIYSFFSNEVLDNSFDDFEINLDDTGYEIDSSYDTLRHDGHEYYYFLGFYHPNNKVLPSKSDLNKQLEVSKTLKYPCHNIICLADKQDEKMKILGKISYKSSSFLVVKFDLEYLMRAYIGTIDSKDKEEVFRIIKENCKW